MMAMAGTLAVATQKVWTAIFRVMSADHCDMVATLFLQRARSGIGQGFATDPRMKGDRYIGMLTPLPCAVWGFLRKVGVGNFCRCMIFNAVLAYTALGVSETIDSDAKGCPGWYPYEWKVGQMHRVPGQMRRYRRSGRQMVLHAEHVSHLVDGTEPFTVIKGEAGVRAETEVTAQPLNVAGVREAADSAAEAPGASREGVESPVLPGFVRGPVIGSGLESVSVTVPCEAVPTPAHEEGETDRTKEGEEEEMRREDVLEPVNSDKPTVGPGRPEGVGIAAV